MWGWCVYFYTLHTYIIERISRFGKAFYNDVGGNMRETVVFTWFQQFFFFLLTLLIVRYYIYLKLDILKTKNKILSECSTHTRNWLCCSLVRQMFVGKICDIKSVSQLIDLLKSQPKVTFLDFNSIFCFCKLSSGLSKTRRGSKNVSQDRVESAIDPSTFKCCT